MVLGLNISIIIPVYNESENIGAFLEYLPALRDQCEIIFVDGGSSDDTVRQIEGSGGTVLISPDKGRANQMNYGASHANGDILWFLHADSAPPKNALSLIRDVINKGYKAGCFPIRFDSRHPLMFIIAFLSNFLRVRIRNIAFGDQGIFILRSLFQELGGYAVIPLMEDYQLSLDVKKANLKFGMAKGKIVTSGRRYKMYGIVKTTRRMQILQRKFRRGDDIEEIARMYDS